MRSLGVMAIPLITGFVVDGPETPYWPPPGKPLALRGGDDD